MEEKFVACDRAILGLLWDQKPNKKQESTFELIATPERSWSLQACQDGRGKVKSNDKEMAWRKELLVQDDT